MKRNREEEEVDRAIALSLASVADQRAAYRAAETQQHEEELSCAVAASLAEVDPEPVCRAPGEWDCLRCTRTNPADAGRCASCESDRMAPFASARPAAVTEVRCGLAGCSRLKAETSRSMAPRFGMKRSHCGRGHGIQRVGRACRCECFGRVGARERLGTVGS